MTSFYGKDNKYAEQNKKVKGEDKKDKSSKWSALKKFLGVSGKRGAKTKTSAQQAKEELEK